MRATTGLLPSAARASLRVASPCRLRALVGLRAAVRVVLAVHAALVPLPAGGVAAAWPPAPRDASFPCLAVVRVALCAPGPRAAPVVRLAVAPAARVVPPDHRRPPAALAPDDRAAAGLR